MTRPYLEPPALSSRSSIRGYIMSRILPTRGACLRQRPVDDPLELGDSPLDVVVRDQEIEVARLLGLAARQLESLADLPRALGRPLPKAALELGEARSLHEDRHGVWRARLHLLGALGLELQDAAPAGAEDPLDFLPERPVAVAGDV